MTKLVSKKSLKYIDGYIMDCNSNIVDIGSDIYEFLNDLDIYIQKAEYIKSQPKGQLPPTMNGFKPKSERKVYQIEEPETPNLDARAALAKSILDETIKSSKVKLYNEYIEQNASMFEWLDSDRIVVLDSINEANRFDLPTLGNPLELTVEKVIEFISNYEDVAESLLEE